MPFFFIQEQPLPLFSPKTEWVNGSPVLSFSLDTSMPKHFCLIISLQHTYVVLQLIFGTRLNYLFLFYLEIKIHETLLFLFTSETWISHDWLPSKTSGLSKIKAQPKGLILTGICNELLELCQLSECITGRCCSTLWGKAARNCL